MGKPVGSSQPDEGYCGTDACFYNAKWSLDRRFISASLRSGDHAYPPEVFAIRIADGRAWLAAVSGDIDSPWRVCRAGPIEAIWQGSTRLIIGDHYQCGLTDIVFERSVTETKDLPQWFTSGRVDPQPVSKWTTASIRRLVAVATHFGGGSLSGMTVGPDGSIFFVDDRLLRRLSPGGGLSTVRTDFSTVDTDTDSRVNNLAGVALSPTRGDLILADLGFQPGPGSKLAELSMANGSALRTFARADLGGIGGMISDARSGSVYYSAIALNQIMVVGRGGQPTTMAGGCSGGVRIWDCPAGVRDGNGSSARFNSPLGVARDPQTGDIFVADTYNDEIRRIDQRGNVTTLAGACAKVQPYPDCAPGFRDGQGIDARFCFPEDLVFDPGQRVLFVADTGNDAVRRVAMDGQVSTVSTSLSGEPALSLPTSVALDQNSDDLLILDSGNLMLRRVSHHGDVSVIAKNLMTFENPDAIAVDSEGNIFLAHGRNIGVFPPGASGAPSASRVIGLSTPGPIEIESLAVDSRRNLYAADPVLGRIFVYNATTTLHEPPARLIEVDQSALGTIQGIAIGPSRALYVLTNKFILKYAADATGRAVPERSVGAREAGLHEPLALTVDDHGLVYVADNTQYSLTSNVLVFALDSSAPSKAIRKIVGYDPTSLATDNRGELLMADLGKDSIFVFGSGGSQTNTPTRTIAGPQGVIPNSFNITTDSSGRLYTTGFKSWAVAVFSPDAAGDAWPIRTMSWLYSP